MKYKLKYVKSIYKNKNKNKNVFHFSWNMFRLWLELNNSRIDVMLRDGINW